MAHASHRCTHMHMNEVVADFVGSAIEKAVEKEEKECGEHTYMVIDKYNTPDEICHHFFLLLFHSFVNSTSDEIYHHFCIWVQWWDACAISPLSHENACLLWEMSIVSFNR